MIILMQIIAFLLVLRVVYVRIHMLKIRRLCSWVPIAKGWPVIGPLLEFGGRTETLNDISRLTNNPSKLCYIEVADFWNIIIRNYDLLEFVLSSPTILDKSVDYSYLQPWLGTGLLTAPGNKWKTRRKMITPAFHFAILEQFVEVFESNSNKLIEKLKLEAINKERVDIYNYVNACTLDTICETAMGVNIDSQSNKNQDYVLAVKDMCRIATTRTFSSWRRHNILFRFTDDYKKQQCNLKILHHLTNSVIERRKRERQNNITNDSLEEDQLGRKRKLAFLDLLLDSTIDGQPLSQEDIREEVDTFMFEGHDTTSSAISSALFLLANHPEIQEKVRDEQKLIYGKDRDRTTTYQDLQEMKYLDLVIKEALRLYPPVPIIARYVSEDTNYKHHVIPKNTILSLYIYGINRDPDYFENPDEFRPDRFLESTGNRPYSYIPFSAGPRNCIGQRFAMLELKSNISKIIRNLELYPTDPPHKLLLCNEAVLKSLNGVQISLKEHIWE